MALDTMATTTDLSFEDLVPVARGRVLYVLEWNSEDSLDGMKEAFAIVVLKRAGGCLLALPEGFLSVEDLRDGGEMGSVIGPSVSVVVNAMHVDAPVGLEIRVVILDVDQAIVGAMRLAEEVEETAMPFFPDDPFALPSGEELVAKSMAWLQNTSQVQQEGWYSQEVTAESDVQTPKAPKARPSRAKAAADGGIGSGSAAKPKRQTTAWASFVYPDAGDDGQAAEHGGADEEQPEPGSHPSAAPGRLFGNRSEVGSFSKGFWFPPSSSEGVTSFGTKPWRRAGKGRGASSVKGGGSPSGCGSGHTGPVDRPDVASGNLGGKPTRPDAGPPRIEFGHPRCLGPCEVAGGVGPTARHLFPLCSTADEQEDDADIAGGPALCAACPTRSDGLLLLRTFWRLWEAERTGADCKRRERLCTTHLGQLAIREYRCWRILLQGQQLTKVEATLIEASLFHHDDQQRQGVLQSLPILHHSKIQHRHELVKRSEILGGKASGSGDGASAAATPKVKGVPKKKGRGKGKAEAEEEQADQ